MQLAIQFESAQARVCTCCNKKKDLLTGFHFKRDGLKRRHNKCKECRNESRRARYMRQSYNPFKNFSYAGNPVY